MTNEEAIEYLKKADVTVYQEPKTKTAEALEMAIESLKHIPCYLDSPCEYQNPDIKIPHTDCIVWHPYPKEKPTESGEYNITIRNLNCVILATYDAKHDSWEVPNTLVIAWTDLLKPYGEKEGAEE